MIRSTALLLLFLAAPANCEAYRLPDLNGRWHAAFTIGLGTKDEEVQIVQRGSDVRGTKITGDLYVPAGSMNFRASYTGRHFQAEQLCAAVNFQFKSWMAVDVTIIDQNHFKVEGGCSGEAVWSRDERTVS